MKKIRKSKKPSLILFLAIISVICLGVFVYLNEYSYMIGLNTFKNDCTALSGKSFTYDNLINLKEGVINGKVVFGRGGFMHISEKNMDAYKNYLIKNKSDVIFYKPSLVSDNVWGCTVKIDSNNMVRSKLKSIPSD